MGKPPRSPKSHGKSQHRKEVGENLRLAIEALGISQAEVARLFKVSPQNLGNWLRGDSYPSEWFVKQFCDRYQVSADWIYRGQVPASASPLADALWSAREAKSEAREVLGNRARETSED